MNAKKEIFHKENKKDYSLNQGAIKSAEDAGIKNKTVSDMVEWIDDSDETYCEEEYNILIYRDKDGLLQSRRRHK